MQILVGLTLPQRSLKLSSFLFIYVCMYVCMHVCMYVCIVDLQCCVKLS